MERRETLAEHSKGKGKEVQGGGMMTSRPTGYTSLELKADLYKESKTFRGRTWTTRYFLLSGQWLFYYKSQSSYSKGDPPHKALDVADTWIMEKGIVKSGSKKLYTITINHQRPETPDKDVQVLCIGTPNIEEYALWRDSLKKARQRAQERRNSALGGVASRAMSGDSSNGVASGPGDSPSTASSRPARADGAPASAAGAQPPPPAPAGSFRKGSANEPESPKDGGSLRGRFSSDIPSTSRRTGSAGNGAQLLSPPAATKAAESGAAGKPPAAGPRTTTSGNSKVPRSSELGSAVFDGNTEGPLQSQSSNGLRGAQSEHGPPATPAGAPHGSGAHHGHSQSHGSGAHASLHHSVSGATVSGDGTPMPGVESGVARSSKMSNIRRVESFIPPELVEYQQLAKTGIAAGLPSIRPSETGLRFGAAAAAAAATDASDGAAAQAFPNVNEEEEQGDQGESVDYNQFDIWRLAHLENGLRFEEDSRWYIKGGTEEHDGDSDPSGGQPLGFVRRSFRALTAPPPPCRVRGRVRAPPKLIHHLLADNGLLRRDWDPTFLSGREVEPDPSDDISGHSQLVHLVLRPLNVWGINCSRPRDAVLLQHWRLEEGTYLMTFTSMPKYDRKVPVEPGAVRFSTGGFIEIRPMGGDSGESLVTMVLEKTQSNGWQRTFTGRPRAFQHALLAGYVAGLRDFVNQLSEDGMNRISDWVAAKEKGLEATAAARLYRGDGGHWGDEEEEDDSAGCSSSDGALSAFSSVSWHDSLPDALYASPSPGDACSAASGSGFAACAARLADAEAEEVGDDGVVHRMSVDEDSQSYMPSVVDGDTESELGGPAGPAMRTPPPAGGAEVAPGGADKRAPSLAGTPTPMRTRTRSTSVDQTDPSADETIPVLLGDAGGTIPLGAWPPTKGVKSEGIFCQPEASLFRVRSKTYLQNSIKCAAGPPYMSLIATDWIYADKRIDHVCRRPQNVVQRSFLKQYPKGYVFCVNLQVPAAKQYSIIFYFGSATRPPPESTFGKFIDGDDMYKAQRFKLIPSITQGPWVVARSVGTTPLIVGNALKAQYYSTPNYLECDIDIGTSSVAQNVCKFVIGYLRSLVIDLAFLVESKLEADLPERLIGNTRIAFVDPAHALPAWPEN